MHRRRRGFCRFGKNLGRNRGGSGSGQCGGKEVTAVEFVGMVHGRMVSGNLGVVGPQIKSFLASRSVMGATPSGRVQGMGPTQRTPRRRKRRSAAEPQPQIPLTRPADTLSPTGGYLFSVGGAGDSPAPLGDPPSGTGEIVWGPDAPCVWSAIEIASGESPDATGGSPVLPTLNTCPRRSECGTRRSRNAGCFAQIIA